MSVDLERTNGSTTVSPDVIHDLGYRHYDGPRLGRRAIWTALAAESLRGSYGIGRSPRSKVVPLLCLVVICMPAIIMGVASAVLGADELPVDYPDYVLNVQPLVALFVAAQAPAVVSRDLRFGAVPLHFSRPMRRVDYVSAKLAALWAAVLVLLSAPLTLLLAGAMLAEMPLSEQLPDYLRSLAQAALLALLLASIGTVIAAITPRRGLGVAAIITVLLVLAGVQGIVQEIAAEQGQDVVASWSQLLSPFTAVQAVGSSLLGADSPLQLSVAGGLAFLLAAAALVAACWGALVLRFRKV